MTQAQKVLLSLLRSSLNGGAPEFDPDTDWEAVFEEAQVQNVTVLAAKALPGTLSPAQYRRWKNIPYVHLANYARYMSEQDRLCRLFAGKEIPMVILKGTAAAVYYPDPSLRAMGDIDLLVPPEQFEAAGTIVQQAGYLRLEEDRQGRHTEFTAPGDYEVSLELHRRFSYNGLDVEAYITAGMAHPETGSIDGCSFPMLPRLANGIVLLTHIRQHLRSGLGLRHMIDWMMYVRQELDNDFWESEFRPAVREKNLETLALTATRLCQLYLGLSGQINWCSRADDSLCSRLMENILNSGDFGRKDGTQNMVGDVAIKIRKEGLFPFLQRVGERDWKAFHHCPWLRPAAWLYEALLLSVKVLKLKRGRPSFRSQRSHDREKYDLLEQLGLI